MPRVLGNLRLNPLTQPKFAHATVKRALCDRGST